jgi:hypothetical protein
MNIWLMKLIFSHFVTDFVLQKKSWIDHRRSRHFLSVHLYIHTFITAVSAWIFIGWKYWWVALIIFLTHTIIDGWKSYQADKVVFFLVDQILHLSVIFGCWVLAFGNFNEIKLRMIILNSDVNVWLTTTALLFLTFPSAILIGELTKTWRKDLPNTEALANAGRWIGIIERILILLLVLKNQYEAVGLLVAAKTIIRFSDNSRTEQKTEYLLIGTLISIGLAIMTGIFVQQFRLGTVN